MKRTNLTNSPGTVLLFHTLACPPYLDRAQLQQPLRKDGRDPLGSVTGNIMAMAAALLASARVAFELPCKWPISVPCTLFLTPITLEYN